MAAFTNYSSNYIVSWLAGKAAMPSVNIRYITASDTILPGGTEQMNAMTGSSNRKQIIANTYWTANATLAAIHTTANVVFTASSSGSATVGYVSIWDAITGGNMLGQAQVTSKSLTAGDSLQITSGNLTISIS